MKRQAISLVTGLATLATVGVTSAGVALSASSPSTSKCHVTAGDPTASGGVVGQWTGRYNGTTGDTCVAATFKSMLRRDIPWKSDPIDFTDTRNAVTTVSVKAQEKCTNYGRANYYTSANTNGGATSVDSAHVTTC